MFAPSFAQIRMSAPLCIDPSGVNIFVAFVLLSAKVNLLTSA